MLALSVVCTAAAVVWAYLAIGHGGYWRTGQRLPPFPAPTPAPAPFPAPAPAPFPAPAPAPAAGRPARWPGVVAVVPARNEAAILPGVLPTLLGQDYPGALTVILVDDCSTDGTAEAAVGVGHPGRALRVVAGAPPPPGWAGKVWAMAQGLAAAGDGAVAGPKGSGSGYVLFTDADIAWEAGALRALVRAAEADDRDLVSQMALLRTATEWERVVVPAFVYFFAQLYPFARVNSPRSRTAAAAGGCMLVRREALARSGGLAPISGSRIDDVALGRVVKAQRGRCWLGLSTAVVSVRPYPRLADLWHMVARSAYLQLRYSPWLLAMTVAGLAFVYVLPPAGAIIGLAAGAATAPAALAAGAGLAGWALMSLTYLPMLRLYRLSPLRAPGLPLIAMLYAAMTVDSARRHYAGRGAEWKGRTDCGRLRLLGGRYIDSGPAVGRRGGHRLVPLPHRRRLYRHSAGRQPARGVPRRPRPGRGRDAAYGPGAEPVRDGVLPARHPRRRRQGQDLHQGQRAALRRASGARLGVRAGRGPGHLPGNPGNRRRGGSGRAGTHRRPDHVRPDGAAHPGARAVRGRRGTAGRAGRIPSRSGLPVEAYRNGPRHVYVELPGEAEVAALRPDQNALARLGVGVSTFAGRSADKLERVLVGGSAVIVARGEYRLS